MSEVKLTSLDSNQIPRYSYSEDNRAIRVEVVNGQMNYQAPVQKNEVRVETIEVPVIIKELEIKEIEKQVIVQNLQIIRIPEYIKEIEYREIEKPVYITEIKTVEIPLIVKEKEIVFVDKINYKIVFVMQAITLALIVLTRLWK